MEINLNTDRLIIRNLDENDNYAWLEIFSSEKVGEFLPLMRDIETINRSIANKIKKYSENPGGSFSIVLKENNKVIGNIELKIIEDTAKLSYVFNDKYWNRGYCTEACFSLIDYAFSNLKLNKILADCLSNNHASNHLLKNKLHMQFLREEIPEGENVPFKFFELTKLNWQS